MPNKQSLAQFGQSIKAKHPEYADMADTDVAQKVLAKYPQYADMVQAGSTATPAPAKQGFLSSFADSSGLSGIASAIMHPLDTAHAISAATTDDAIKGYAQNALQQARNEAGLVRSGNPGQAAVESVLHAPIVGGILNKAMNQAADAGMGKAGQSYGQNLRIAATDPSTMGTLSGAAAGALAPEVAGAAMTALPAIPGAIGRGVRGAITAGSDLNEPILGTSTTPLARYQAAKRLGVPLDMADATNAPIPRALKAINQDSLLGSSTYEKAKVRNIAALNASTDATVNSMSPLDREAGGALLQSDLQADHANLLADSKSGYGQIAQQYGDAPIGVKNSQKLFSVADEIKNETAAHTAQFPSLQPRQVSGIVDDASRFGKPDAPTTGAPMPSPYASPTVSDALKARSGILDVYQNNPELVKSAADAQLQRLVGGAHDAVMDSLPTDAQNTLRDAQLKFKEAKQTYDNPSSPLYNAVRTPNPSSLVTGVGSATPENLSNILPRISPEGQGVIQRGAAEKALGTAPGQDSYNFQTFPRQLSKIPSDYASGLFGDKLPALQDISDTSQAISKDLNPSGSAKQGQKILEGSSLASVPFGNLAGAAPLLQYPLAKVMNSPALVDWVMKQSIPSTIPVPASQGVLPINAAYVNMLAQRKQQ